MVIDVATKRNYYDGDAPDGVYDVLPYEPDIPRERGYVYFPMSETSGSELHGKWKVSESVFLSPNVWYSVRLVENVIVEATLKGHMSPF